jgi:integrase
MATADLPYVSDTRHSFATLALAAGVPIEWIAKQLGHRDTRVTLRHYARWLPVTDERWLGALDAFGAVRPERVQAGREEA